MDTVPVTTFTPQSDSSAPQAAAFRHTHPSRASQIALAGSALAAGGIIWRAIDQGVFSTGDGPAYAAWQEAAAEPGNPVSLVRAALLAANNHNTQPWILMAGDTSIDLYADRSRNTGSLDPMLREMHISLGAALENLEVAAGPNGFSTVITLDPDKGNETHVAHIALTPAAVSTSRLFDAIPLRHTDRAAFQTGRVPSRQELDALRGLNQNDRIDLIWLTSEAERATFSDLTIRATEAIIADEQQSIDSFIWLRSDWDELQRSKDGITLDTSGLSPLMRAAAKIIPATSRGQSDASWLNMTKHPQLSTASAFGVIVANNTAPTYADFISAGRLYQRISLHATLGEMAMQPLNQIPERIDRETSLGLRSLLATELATLLGREDAVAVMPFRIGFPTTGIPVSPRRPATEVISGSVPNSSQR